MKTIDSDTVHDWIKEMAQQLRSHLGDDLANSVMVGIHTGGVKVAKELHQELQLDNPLGELNISFYRDDFSRIGLHPTVGASQLPNAVEDQVVILVDDVIYSGRTIRAAMNELFDFGRPRKIILAALIERKGHELPIRADVIGRNMDLQACEYIKLQQPDMSLLVTAKPDTEGAR